MAVRFRSPSVKPVIPIRPAEPHVAFTEPRRHVVQPNAVGVERDAAVDRLDRVGHRQHADAAVGDVCASGEHRLVERTADLRLDRGGAAAAEIAVEALQDAEVGISGCLHRDLVAIERDLSLSLQLGAFAREPELVDLEDVLVQREIDRALVLQSVVEQLQVEALDVRFDDEVIDVRELADDADGAAGDGVRERREARLEEADVRVERRVGEPHRQLRVHLRRQRDAARAGDHETGRGRFHLQRQQLAAQRQPAVQLADAFVAGEQVVDAQLDVVSRLVERAGAGGVELQQARQRRLRERRRSSATRPESARRPR